MNRQFNMSLVRSGVGVAESISSKVKAGFNLKYFELINESHMHSGPALESHFKLIAVSDDFTALNLVKRHQAVYRLLKDELDGELHALALHLYDVAEWQAQSGSAPDSPNCQGGSK